MKIPSTWLKQYVKTEKTDAEIAKVFTSLGLMLEKPITNGVLDLEHRFDRADWLSIIGCARDFAAYEKLPLQKPKVKNTKINSKSNVDITVSNTGIVNRFTTRVFKKIKVAHSPEWLANALRSYGIDPINSVVDITNYVMVELGQPLHAQDLNKFTKREICIRYAEKGEKITTLLGTEIILDETVAVLSQNNKACVITGVVGGKDTGVDENTTEIILDAGNYNQSLIRKTARKLKIQNETVLRCDKYLHPKLTKDAIDRATDLILEICGGEVYENSDYYPNPVEPKIMELNYERVHKISGADFKPLQVEDILTRLEYEIVEKNPKGLKLQIPYFRTDIEVQDDIVADILRINGYENIAEEVINVAPPKDCTSEIYRFEEKLRDILVKLGLHEHITDPLVEKINTADEILLENSLSSEKNALRTNITKTLTPLLEIYKKHQYYQINPIKLFEIGKSFIKPTKEIRELEVVVHSQKGIKETSIETNQVLSNLLKELGLEKTHIESTGEIIVAKKQIGKVRYDGFTLQTEKILGLVTKNIVSRAIDITTQSITEDVTLLVVDSIKSGSLVEKIYKQHASVIGASVVAMFAKEPGKKAITIRLTFKAGTNKDTINDIKTSIFGR